MKTLVALLTLVIVAQQANIGPAPGRLVDIGGRKLHFICSGSGSPTVIIEAGASSFAIDFSLVQPEIARTHRVCSYDRAGTGWSDPRGAGDTPSRVIRDLHDGLAAAAEKPPFILVGASRGGLYVRLYQLEYPTQVAGFVLIDPATEDRLFTMHEGQAVAIASLTAEQLAASLPASGSFPNRRRAVQTGTPFDRLPPDVYKQRLALDRRLIEALPESVTAEFIRESSEADRAMLARLLKSRAGPDNPFARVPVVVLTRTADLSNGLSENHSGLARLAKNSRHSLVTGAGHEIHLFAPAAVVEAVQDVSTAVRQRTQLPPRG
jgi:pimeloyl-ACP methyl ester carboxylesterase